MSETPQPTPEPASQLTPQPSPGLRAQKTAATRRAIGEAAIDLFVEVGFANTSIDAIAERAGVSRRSFFNYFETKQAAAFPDHEDRLARLIAALEGADDAGMEATMEVIVDAVRAFVLDERHRQRYRLLLHIPELREQDMRDDLDYEDALNAHFLADRTSPTADERFEARCLAAQLVGTLRAALTTWALIDGSFDPVAAIRRAHRDSSAWDGVNDR